MAKGVIVEEEWRIIPGFGGFYEVSNLGRVRSWRKCGHGENRKLGIPKILKANVGSCGYPQVMLTAASGAKIWFRVYRLVLLTFVGERPQGKEAAHNNGIKTDNRLENLRYATRSENHLDKIRHGTMLCGEHHPNARLTNTQVHRIRGLLMVGGCAGEIARQFSVSRHVVRCIKSGETWKTV